jgi:hypothetical protein
MEGGVNGEPTRLNAVQRAYMREWLNSCIRRVQAQPPGARREQTLATLRRGLQRYEERPQLTVIAGGRQ